MASLAPPRWLSPAAIVEQWANTVPRARARPRGRGNHLTPDSARPPRRPRAHRPAETLRRPTGRVDDSLASTVTPTRVDGSRRGSTMQPAPFYGGRRVGRPPHADDPSQAPRKGCQRSRGSVRRATASRVADQKRQFSALHSTQARLERARGATQGPETRSGAAAPARGETQQRWSPCSRPQCPARGRRGSQRSSSPSCWCHRSCCAREGVGRQATDRRPRPDRRPSLTFRHAM